MTWYDLADPSRLDWWLHHPEIGDISFDTFTRLSANPLYVGEPPYEWPVNGFLLRDPQSNNLYVYAGVYSYGYWGEPSYCRLLRSRDNGANWEDLGPVLEGTIDLFDSVDGQRGHSPDVSVVYDDGIYHMIYDWGRHTTEEVKRDGGWAYAWSRSPEGPFERYPEPCFAQSNQPTVFGLYQMSYAAALVKRANDWLVITDMSTRHNHGGTWALVAFTAKHPGGPYSGPHFLLWPQTSVFYPTTVESFPVFPHDGYVYAPNTSVARNRTYQILYRAPIERAHLAEAWEVYQNGSVWHAEASDNEYYGIWGQTFSAEVEADGTMWAMFACKNSADCGTINVAHRPWDTPYRHGGVISAPSAPALTLVQRDYTAFNLKASLRSTGALQLVWQHRAPLGADKPSGAEGAVHPLSLGNCAALRLSPQGWALVRRDACGNEKEFSSGTLAPEAERYVVELEQCDDTLAIRLNGVLLWEGDWLAVLGCIGLIAEAHTRLWVDEFLISAEGSPARRALLPTEGTMGYGLLGDTWQESRGSQWRYGFGYTSEKPAAGCKWNWYGGGFTLWAPLAPHFGKCAVWVDGVEVGELDFGAPEAPSTPRYTHELPRGYHAVALIAKSGVLPCDSCEVAL
ncbi:MAG: hypothetical protein GXY52_03540 [Chloroflexi bacterium]|nr:hypothetical protein [Chloroflexota bacterium]